MSVGTSSTGQTVGVTAKGVVESGTDIELSSQVKGTIRRVLVEDGATVKAGQLLLEFDTTKIEAQRRQMMAALAAAEARYREMKDGYRTEDVAMAKSGRERSQAVVTQAKDEFDRQRRLYDKGATTLVELNRAEERLRVAEGELGSADANLAKFRYGTRNEDRGQARAEVERARAELSFVDGVLKDYRVYAPISGLVAGRFRDAGEGADIGTPLLHLINPETLRIRAELEETDVGRVKEGQKAEVTMDAYRGKVFAGTVAKVFPVVLKKTQKSFDPMASFDINTQKIHVRLDNYSGLKNGMTVTVRFK
ncbi:HlyD family secretion protein [Geobacter argillaceus]|uniref:HlyD family secretion protein n=1 Tax=Geobacter argillaceus TaxID=345631 RepID=UPI0014791EC5|nr:efflux RND transporter periplasmic adaptor subunit [Geobacter argillaceus]